MNSQVPLMGLRTRLMLLRLTLLPACGFILHTRIGAHQQAAERARGATHGLRRLLAQPQQGPIESVHLQLLGLAQLPVVRHPNYATLGNRTFGERRAQKILYAHLGVIGADGVLRCCALPHTGGVRPS